MRLVYAFTLAAAVALVVAPVRGAQQEQEKDRSVAGGGITAPGWKGRIDPASAKQGKTINDSKFAKEGDALHLSIGPAAVYWNPENTASGDYTVKGTFKEGKTTSDHPHPYGIFIGGSNMDGDAPTLVYCVAYGDGTYLVRGFSNGTVFQVSKRQPHTAVHKTGADGGVTQDIQWTVKGSRAECSINGTMVAGYDKGEIVGPGKLESLDGITGIRVSHNVDVAVTGFGIAK